MWCPSKLTQGQIEERRLEGGRLLRVGHLTHAEIAQRLGVSLRAVQYWAERLRKHPHSGLRALRRRSKSGRPPWLCASQWRSVLRVLRKGALKAGFETDRWTLRRIRDLIRRQFGVAYNPNYLAARLRASDWSPQIPAIRAKERDEETIRAWLEQEWPRIRRKSPAKACGHRLHR
ncbi:MAG: winged helix-turn-helix domain-containing protein [Isosphaeraceae bacterium]